MPSVPRAFDCRAPGTRGPTAALTAVATTMNPLPMFSCRRVVLIACHRGQGSRQDPGTVERMEIDTRPVRQRASVSPCRSHRAASHGRVHEDDPCRSTASRAPISPPCSNVLSPTSLSTIGRPTVSRRNAVGVATSRREAPRHSLRPFVPEVHRCRVDRSVPQADRRRCVVGSRR